LFNFLCDVIANCIQSVAYCSIDVETVTDVSYVQSFGKGQPLPVIQSESESDVEPDDNVSGFC